MKMTTLVGKILIVWAILPFCQAGFAQSSPGQVAELQNGVNTKDIKAYYTAFVVTPYLLIIVHVYGQMQT